jgi:hypothetical protein
MLHTHLYAKERVLPSSILHERVATDLAGIRARSSYDLPGEAREYISMWVREEWLERRLPTGATEEEYELSTAAIDAIRFTAGMENPHAAATESRLLEATELARQIFDTINRHLAEKDLMMREGAIVDATLIAAPPSNRNQDGNRDPEMHQSKKGNDWPGNEVRPLLSYCMTGSNALFRLRDHGFRLGVLEVL